MKKLQLNENGKAYYGGSVVYLVSTAIKGNNPMLLTQVRGFKKPMYELGRWRVLKGGYEPTREKVRLLARELELLGQFFAGKVEPSEMRRLRQKMLFGVSMNS